MASFWKPEACGQTVLPDRSVLIRQKLVEMPKFKNSNATFWVIFKHCVETSVKFPNYLFGGCWKWTWCVTLAGSEDCLPWCTETEASTIWGLSFEAIVNKFVLFCFALVMTSHLLVANVETQLCCWELVTHTTVKRFEEGRVTEAASLRSTARVAYAAPVFTAAWLLCRPAKEKQGIRIVLFRHMCECFSSI